MKRKELLMWSKEELRLYLRAKMDTPWGKGYIAGRRDALREFNRRLRGHLEIRGE